MNAQVLLIFQKLNTFVGLSKKKKSAKNLLIVQNEMGWKYLRTLNIVCVSAIAIVLFDILLNTSLDFESSFTAYKFIT